MALRDKLVSLFSVGGFISLFLILSHHLKYREIMTSAMQDFNFDVSYMLIAFNCKTHNDLKIVYVRFDLDKTSFIFLFFKSLLYHLNCLCDTYLICMKLLIGAGLTSAEGTYRNLE